MDHGATNRAAGQVVGGRYRLDRLDTATPSWPDIAVWAAVDTWSGRPVRVHLASPPAHLPPADHGAWLDSATDRARQFGRLSTHPLLLVLRDAGQDGGQDGGQLWTVIDSPPARSLGESVRTAGPIPPDRLRALLDDLLEGLRAVHGLGLVHGLVTPDSVLLTADGRGVVVCPGTPPDSASTSGAGSGSAPARLLAYQAPERLAGRSGDPAADIFSLGAVAYFTAEGRGPFDRGDDVATTRYAVMYQPLEPPVRAGALAGPIMAMLAQQPTARPTAASALAPPPAATESGSPTGTAAATGTAAPTGTVAPIGYGGYPGTATNAAGQPGLGLGPFPFPPGGGRPPQPSKRSRAPWYAGAVVALLLIAAVAVGLVLTSGNPSGPTTADGSQSPAGRPTATDTPSSPSPSPSPSTSRSRPPLPTRPPSEPALPGEDDYDPALRKAFLDTCAESSGGATDVCTCVIEEFETRYTQDEFIELNTKPQSPETQEAFASVALLCSSTTDA